MADKPVLEYEPLSARGLRRKTVIALLAASAGAAVVVGGVVYRLSQPAPVAVAPSAPPAPIQILMGDIVSVPTTMPWTPAQPPAPPEVNDGR